MLPPLPDTRLAQRQTHRRNIVSLTPLIDVVFILLVFFMLASSFLDWRSIQLDAALPAAGMSQSSDQNTLLLSVSTTQTKLNGETLPLPELLRRITQRLDNYPNQLLHVQPLADTPLQTVIKVLDQLQAAGINNLNLVRDRTWKISVEQP